MAPETSDPTQEGAASSSAPAPAVDSPPAPADLSAEIPSVPPADWPTDPAPTDVVTDPPATPATVDTAGQAPATDATSVTPSDVAPADPAPATPAYSKGDAVTYTTFWPVTSTQYGLVVETNELGWPLVAWLNDIAGPIPVDDPALKAL